MSAGGLAAFVGFPAADPAPWTGPSHGYGSDARPAARATFRARDRPTSAWGREGVAGAAFGGGGAFAYGDGASSTRESDARVLGPGGLVIPESWRIGESAPPPPSHRVNLRTGGDKQMIEAAAAGDVGKIAALAESNMGKFHMKDQDGNTPLMHAVFNGHAAAVRYLLERGAGVDLANEAGFSPLKLAATISSLEIVQVLVAGGAPLDSKYGNGRTALMAAAEPNRAAGVLLRGGGQPAVTEAVLQEQGAVIAFLSQSGATVDATTRQGQTALMIAAQTGHCEALRALIEAKAGLDLQAKDGKTAVHFAAISGKSVVALEVLLQAGADIEVRDDSHNTALWYCASFGNFYACAGLLRFGANSSTRGGPEGINPCMEASRQGHERVADLLQRNVDKLRRETQRARAAKEAADHPLLGGITRC